MNPNNDMSDFYDYYTQLDMDRYAQYHEYFEQYESLEGDEGESSERLSRRYITGEREVAEEKLRRDYFGDENTPPIYPEEYFRRRLHERTHGLSEMLGSIDCMHWEWTKFHKALHGANNDLNVLYGLLLFDDLLTDKAPEAPFVLNGKTYEKGYYLADEIYPQWSTFFKAFTMARDQKTMKFKRVQESARKDIERDFGVLQGGLPVLAGGQLSDAWNVGPKWLDSKKGNVANENRSFTPILVMPFSRASMFKGRVPLNVDRVFVEGNMMGNTAVAMVLLLPLSEMFDVFLCQSSKILEASYLDDRSLLQSTELLSKAGKAREIPKLARDWPQGDHLLLVEMMGEVNQLYTELKPSCSYKEKTVDARIP
ncbi:reverse transcriptase domain-containing protein [Tanacetum coccineum]